MALNELHGVHSSCKCFIEQDGQVDLPVPGGKATNIALFDNDLYLCLICSGSYRAPPPRKHLLLENNECNESICFQGTLAGAAIPSNTYRRARKKNADLKLLTMEKAKAMPRMPIFYVLQGTLTAPRQFSTTSSFVAESACGASLGSAWNKTVSERPLSQLPRACAELCLAMSPTPTYTNLGFGV